MQVGFKKRAQATDAAPTAREQPTKSKDSFTNTQRTIMLIELVNEGAHAVVIKLNDTRVEGCNHPWSSRMKGKSLHASGLALKLGQHCLIVQRIEINDV